jgi:hypothetical protein
MGSSRRERSGGCGRASDVMASKAARLALACLVCLAVIAGVVVVVERLVKR